VEFLLNGKQQIKKSGLAIINPYNIKDVSKLKHYINQYRDENKNNIIILSIHWGDNWGFDIPSEFKLFAHQCIDECNIQIIHGHSSHHIKGFEIYKQSLILYGCGDFLSDYEGINNKRDREYKSDLSFMYFIDINKENGQIEDIILKGSKVKHFSIQEAQDNDLKWLENTIIKQCQLLNVQLFKHKNDGKLHLKQENKEDEIKNEVE